MIEKNLENGAYVVVKDSDGDYQLFSPYKDPDGYYRSSSWCCSIEEAKKYIGSYGGYIGNLDELAKKRNWEVVEIFYGQQPKFKKGDRVRVLETGDIGVVDSRQDHNKYDIRVSDNFVINCHRSRLAHAEEEPKVEEMTLSEVCKELGRTIVIKK